MIENIEDKNQSAEERSQDTRRFVREVRQPLAGNTPQKSRSI